MFNLKFVVPPIAVMFLLTYGFFFFPKLADFEFHSTFMGGNGYPSGVAFILNLIPSFIPRSISLFCFAMLVSLVLPYILIFEITKNQMASFVYLFGSNVPTMLIQLYFVPQAVIQLFMLASIIYPPFLSVFLLFGSFFHRSWFWAFLLTLGVLIWKRAFIR
jgi:hypothetical protein